jgi:hypothetical protein
MKKSAQPSQYQYAGYDPSMDELGLLPGVSPQEPESKTPGWLLPLGVAAGGLAGYSLLRGAGRGLKGLLGKLRSGRTAVKPEPWNWEAEMLGRGGQARYRSALHPGENVGHGYGPGVEQIVKQSSVRADAFAHVIARLGQVARDA